MSTGCVGHPRERADLLRAELLRRVEAHPVRSWSPALLCAMIAVFDLVWTERPLDPVDEVGNVVYLAGSR